MTSNIEKSSLIVHILRVITLKAQQSNRLGQGAEELTCLNKTLPHLLGEHMQIAERLITVQYYFRLWCVKNLTCVFQLQQNSAKDNM
jgi:hypothetical protein